MPFLFVHWSSLQFRPLKEKSGDKKGASCQKKLPQYLHFDLTFSLWSLSLITHNHQSCHQIQFISGETHLIAVLSYPLYFGGRGAVPRLKSNHKTQSMFCFIPWQSVSLLNSLEFSESYISLDPIQYFAKKRHQNRTKRQLVVQQNMSVNFS